MSNPYFQNLIDLITGNKARATEVEANLSAVEAGFDAVYTDMTAKANKGGQAYTGVHDFSGASEVDVPTPTAGVAGPKAVNMTALLAAIAAVNAVSPQLVKARVSATTTATASIGQDIECRNPAVMTITAPVGSGSTPDGAVFGITTCNTQNNIIDFGVQTVRGPAGTATGQITAEYTNPKFRWDLTALEWVVL